MSRYQRKANLPLLLASIILLIFLQSSSGFLLTSPNIFKIHTLSHPLRLTHTAIKPVSPPSFAFVKERHRLFASSPTTSLSTSTSPFSSSTTLTFLRRALPILIALPLFFLAPSAALADSDSFFFDNTDYTVGSEMNPFEGRAINALLCITSVLLVYLWKHRCDVLDGQERVRIEKESKIFKSLVEELEKQKKGDIIETLKKKKRRKAEEEKKNKDEDKTDTDKTKRVNKNKFAVVKPK